MARLYLHCAICDRKQADGLISGAAWGRLEVDPAVVSDHPALKGSELRVCPTCVGRHPDWQERIRSALGIGGGSGTAFEAAQ
jgi:hypothetical protein